MALQNKDVFINCPFDKGFSDNLSAIVFTTLHCGFTPRTALEIDNGLQYRLDKIINLIQKCHYSIHDLSMVSLDAHTGLPRFNMPFECGLFFATAKIKNSKKALILEKNQFDLKKCLSDLNGIDPKFHNNDIPKLIRCIRDWLNANQKKLAIPGASIISKRFSEFKSDLPQLCKDLSLDHTQLDYVDLIKVSSGYLKAII